MTKNKEHGIYFQFLGLSVGKEPYYTSSPKRYSRFNKESNLKQNWSTREMVINFIRLQSGAHCDKCSSCLLKLHRQMMTQLYLICQMANCRKNKEICSYYKYCLLIVKHFPESLIYLLE